MHFRKTSFFLYLESCKYVKTTFTLFSAKTVTLMLVCKSTAIWAGVIQKQGAVGKQEERMKERGEGKRESIVL